MPNMILCAGRFVHAIPAVRMRCQTGISFKIFSAVFFVILIIGCKGKQDTEAYVTSRIGGVHPAVPIALRGRAAATYAYWQTAHDIMAICSDQSTLMRQRVQPQYVPAKITAGLRTIPTEGVDPVAVRAIRLYAARLDQMNALGTSVSTKGTNLLFALEPAIITGLDSAIGTASSNESVNTSPLRDNSNWKLGSEYLRGMKGLASLSKQMRLEIAAAQTYLTRKYGRLPQVDPEQLGECFVPAFDTKQVNPWSGLKLP